MIVNNNILQLDQERLSLVQRAIASHPRASDYVQLKLLRYLTEGKSPARVIEAELDGAGRGASERCVLKIDAALRLAKEARFTADHGNKCNNFMRVVGRSFDPTNPSDALGCIVYDHPAGHFPGSFESLETRCRDAFERADDEGLDVVLSALGDTIWAVSHGLQKGTRGRLPGAGLEQFQYYLERWAPAAVVEVRHAEFDTARHALRLYLADEAEGFKLQTGRDPILDHGRVGTVVELVANQVYLDDHRVFLNMKNEAAIQIQGIEPGRIRELCPSLDLEVHVRGRLTQTSHGIYAERLRALGLDPESARLRFAGVEFENPLLGYVERARRWSDRQPPPDFVIGHGDLHGGNVLCSERVPVIIDHAWCGDHHPCWADAGRLIGSVWLNAITPLLSLDEVATAMSAMLGSGTTLPLSDRAARAAHFLTSAVGEALRKGPRPETGKRELWIDLHHFAWIGLKWGGSASGHLAMLFLAAVAVETVDSVDRGLALRNEISGPLAMQETVGGVVARVPDVVRTTYTQLAEIESTSQDMRRALYQSVQSVQHETFELMEAQAQRGGGVLADLLDQALLGNWGPLEDQEVGKLRAISRGDGTHDHIVLADILFFACLKTKSVDALGRLVDLASHGDPSVDFEAAILLSFLLCLPGIREIVDAKPLLEHRLRRCFRDQEFVQRAVTASSAWWWFSGLKLRPVFGEIGLPRTLHLRPFGIEEDVPAEFRTEAMMGLWTRFVDTMAIADGDKRAIVAAWCGLTDRRPEDLGRALENESKVRGSISPVAARAIQRVHTLRLFVCHISSDEEQWSLDARRDERSRSFAELVDDKRMQYIVEGADAAELAMELAERGKSSEAVAKHEVAHRSFAAAHTLSALDADQMAEWSNSFLNWGARLGELADLAGEMETARQLREEACGKYQEALRLKPDQPDALVLWALQLGELVDLAGEVETARQLREEACEKYQEALRLKPDQPDVLFNWGVELGELADLAGEAETARRLREESCKKYQEVLRLKPDQPDVLFNWGGQLSALAGLTGEAETVRRLAEEACEKYQEALRLEPDQPAALNNWGVQLRQLAGVAGEVETARRLLEEACGKYQEALRLKPDQHEALFNCGVQLAQLADLAGEEEMARRLREEACAKLQEVLRLKPDQPNALFLWGIQLGQLADLAGQAAASRRLGEEACGKYQEALRLKPDQPNALFFFGVQLGQLAGLAGEVETARRLREEACEKFQEALRLKADQHEALFNWGVQLGQLAGLASEVETARRLREEACEKYQEALHLKPDQPDALLNWGFELGELADLADEEGTARRLREEACEKYQDSLRLKPDQPDVLLNWGVELGELADLADEETARRFREDSCEKYQESLCLEPDQPDALVSWGFELGELAELAGEEETARRLREESCEKYQEALRLEPDQPDALVSWGVELGELADLAAEEEMARRLREEACEKYQEALHLQPDQPNALVSWGDQLGDLADLAGEVETARRLREEACARYQDSLRLQADQPDALVLWGLQLGQLADLAGEEEMARRLREEACEKYQDSLRLEPAQPNALALWGIQLGQLADLAGEVEVARRLGEEACAKYQDSLRLEPDQPDVLDDWASELLHLVSLYEAMPQFSTFERESLQENVLRQCSEALHRCAELRGMSVTQIYNYACLLARRGERSEALDSLRRCLHDSAITAADVRNDPDWETFHADPEWLALVADA